MIVTLICWLYGHNWSTFGHCLYCDAQRSGRDRSADR